MSREPVVIEGPGFTAHLRKLRSFWAIDVQLKKDNNPTYRIHADGDYNRVLGVLYFLVDRPRLLVQIAEYEGAIVHE